MILMADHEITNSASVLLNTASALADPYSCCAAATLSGIGILHGGAIEVAYKQLEAVRDLSEVPALLEGVKSGEKRLYGYGHRKWKVRLFFPQSCSLNFHHAHIHAVSECVPVGGVGISLREKGSKRLGVEKVDISLADHSPASGSSIGIVPRADSRRHAKHGIPKDGPPSRGRA